MVHVRSDRPRTMVPICHGGIEFASAILLLIPALSELGALILIPTTIGAIFTHLIIVGGSPVLSIGLLIVMTIVAWGRKERTLRLINRKMY